MVKPTKKTAFELAPAGSHLGALVQIIDLGTQPNDYGQRDESSVASQRRIFLRWELNDTAGGDGLPLTVGAEFSFSYHERSNLFKILSGWLSRSNLDDLEIESLIGKAGMINIIHVESKKTPGQYWARVASVSPADNDVESELVGPLQFFWLEPAGEVDFEIYESLPSFLKTRINQSPEWLTVQSVGDASEVF